jgi:hypothetical protein
MRFFKRRPKFGVIGICAFPTLGNHECVGDPQQDIEHWMKDQDMPIRGDTYRLAMKLVDRNIQ